MNIYQTSDHDHIPAIKDNIKRLKSFEHVSYQHFSSDECVRFIRKNYSSRVLNAYLSINPAYPAARADLFRYLLMYQKEGLYIDIKSGINRKFFNNVHHDFILSHWDNSENGEHKGYGLFFDGFPNGEFQQFFIYTRTPKNPVLKAVLEDVLHNIEHYCTDRNGVGFKGVLTTTGPVAYTTSIMKFVLNKKGLRIPVFRKNRDAGIIYNNLPGNYRDMLYQGRPHYSTITDPVVLKNKKQQ